MSTADKVIKARQKKDLITAADTGDRLETLIALRDLLAARLQNSKNDRDIAAISRRLMQCVAEIAELEEQHDAKSETAEQLDYWRGLYAGISDRKTGGG